MRGISTLFPLHFVSDYALYLGVQIPAGDINYDESQFIACGFTLTITPADFIPYTNYPLTITSSNQQDDYILVTKRSVNIQLISKPEAGIVKVLSPYLYSYASELNVFVCIFYVAACGCF